VESETGTSKRVLYLPTRPMISHIARDRLRYTRRACRSGFRPSDSSSQRTLLQLFLSPCSLTQATYLVQVDLLKQAAPPAVIICPTCSAQKVFSLRASPGSLLRSPCLTCPEGRQARIGSDLRLRSLQLVYRVHGLQATDSVIGPSATSFLRLGNVICLCAS
jgi:hypothetical protein